MFQTDTTVQVDHARTKITAAHLGSGGGDFAEMPVAAGARDQAGTGVGSGDTEARRQPRSDYTFSGRSAHRKPPPPSRTAAFVDLRRTAGAATVHSGDGPQVESANAKSA
ncbi:hypothetical protein Y900_027955 [Mycolicibacterium aromaticivorans JS19b1 = JCM 16368]|uniref:Uncharacterized protein n=1 Tax=Mycolicibacterium aromaticivorans JS19b1 = JCM 16368 TaxID=1440774 RepID=A0A064C8Z9_9MYCO|nr:hypothetical protein Y900_027955 [Mycolicibacterium aromaticivorans JS19b1 = JCM 16368]